jgi:DeoR family fructose operon transcriptional repressor
LGSKSCSCGDASIAAAAGTPASPVDREQRAKGKERREQLNEPARKRDETGDGNADLPAARQAKLVELVRQHGQVTVGELVARFGVSSDTIRRDLTLLEAAGLLVRTHGGAVPADRMVNPITTLSSRMVKHVSAKQRIGAAAAGLIRDGETLILNAGSTTTYFAAELTARRDLTIVTNNLRLLPALPEQCARSVYLLGGSYLESAQATIGFDGFASMPQISVDTAVIGATGVSADGCSIGTIEEALATRAIMNTSRRTILVADSSKFNIVTFAHFAELRQIEHLVTDAMPEGALRAALDEAGVEILVGKHR